MVTEAGKPSRWVVCCGVLPELKFGQGVVKPPPGPGRVGATNGFAKERVRPVAEGPGTDC